MTRLDAGFPSQTPLILLSQLLLTPRGDNAPPSYEANWIQTVKDLRVENFDELVAFAQSNHVIVRGLNAWLVLVGENHATEMFQRTKRALAAEETRVTKTIHFLHEICTRFQEHGIGLIVIKSLDHWPDIGSDLDLYTNARPNDVSELMISSFDARIAERSWGDRLANKWNFLLPGLPEPVEVHIGRLGQTGEQANIASAVIKRARWVEAGGYAFRVPSIPDCLMISTLQRMYRHFNLRLCDIVDSAALADGGVIDYEQLRLLAIDAGIWEGVATYLKIVSDYVMSYRGTAIDLPEFVSGAARFGGSDIGYGRGLLRIPILPHSARLYGSQLAGVLARGELQNGARLTLLPWLATVAAAKQKLTGSDKGIW